MAKKQWDCMTATEWLLSRCEEDGRESHYREPSWVNLLALQPGDPPPELVRDAFVFANSAAFEAIPGGWVKGDEVMQDGRLVALKLTITPAGIEALATRRVWMQGKVAALSTEVDPQSVRRQDDHGP